jgi:predicted membrane-bound spermidine synthase
MAGMCTLAIEITASRLLGYVFGTSNPVWASIIGLTLIYLTAGYFIGGRWADRMPRVTVFYQIIVWGAFAGGLMPLIARPILSVAGTAMLTFAAPAAIAAFVVIMVLFAIPITLLGCVSPFAIRLAMNDVQASGQTAGRLYAISTLGSIIGTFLPTLYTIPEWGTTFTFFIFAMALLTVALIGLWRESRKVALRWVWMPILLTAVTTIALNGPLRPPPAGTTLLYEKESAYNYIQVVQFPRSDGSQTRYLLLNEGQGIHSEWNDKNLFYGRTWDYFMVAPFFNAAPYAPGQVRRIAIVGLAGGTIARQFTAVFGDVAIDGIEIDPAIVEAGRKYFEMNQPGLNVIVEDGRLAMKRLTQPFDLIALDAYRVPYVPWNLTTVEFFRELRGQLTANGVVVINVGRTVNTRTGVQDRRLIEAMTNTMQHVFPIVYTIDVPGSFNTILVATRDQSSATNLAANLNALPADAHPILKPMLELALQNLKTSKASEVLFTDDRAPVETIVDSMVIDFLTGGGTQQFTR